MDAPFYIVQYGLPDKAKDSNQVNNGKQNPINDFSKIGKKPKSQKTYMVVLYFTDGTDDVSVEFVTGQSQTRQMILNIIDQIDIHMSFVLVEDVPFGILDGKPSVYQFLKWISSNYNDGFNIEDYNTERHQDEENEKEYMKMREIELNGDVPSTFQDQQINVLTDINNLNVKELR